MNKVGYEVHCAKCRKKTKEKKAYFSWLVRLQNEMFGTGNVCSCDMMTRPCKDQNSSAAANLAGPVLSFIIFF